MSQIRDLGICYKFQRDEYIKINFLQPFMEATRPIGGIDKSPLHAKAEAIAKAQCQILYYFLW